MEDKKDGKFKKGSTPWNKGLKGILKPNSGSFKKGNNNRLGSTNSEETRQKISQGNKGKKQTEEAKIKISNYNLRVGKKPPVTKGENHYNWQGGKSFEIYPQDWTETLKRSIRERDNYVCKVCSTTHNDREFHVHHIDYNKKNCNPNNLITLCTSCHVKTNSNRKMWADFFTNLMKQICL